MQAATELETRKRRDGSLGTAPPSGAICTSPPGSGLARGATPNDDATPVFRR